jgi:hypothetical protein
MYTYVWDLLLFCRLSWQHGCVQKGARSFLKQQKLPWIFPKLSLSYVILWFLVSLELFSKNVKSHLWDKSLLGMLSALFWPCQYSLSYSNTNFFTSLQCIHAEFLFSILFYLSTYEFKLCQSHLLFLILQIWVKMKMLIFIKYLLVSSDLHIWI